MTARILLNTEKTRGHRPRLQFLFCCFALCLFSTVALAETRGQVMFGGVAVPGATVTVTQGGKTFTTITDPMGTYAFPDLPEGIWPIDIEMLGFAKLHGDTSTVLWELKMLPMEEIKAEVAHGTPAPATAPGPASVA